MTLPPGPTAPEPGDIRSPRLLLRLIDRQAIRALRGGDRASAAARLGAAVPPAFAAASSGLGWSMAQLDADPGYAPWSSRALILAAERRVVGHLRFHERPEPANPHPFGGAAAELGYMVLPADRRRGYAAEAVRAAMAWAEASYGIRRFILSIAPDNVASLALARSLGFMPIGEQIDEVDGTELVLLRASQAMADGEG